MQDKNCGTCKWAKITPKTIGSGRHAWVSKLGTCFLAEQMIEQAAKIAQMVSPKRPGAFNPASMAQIAPGHHENCPAWEMKDAAPETAEGAD